MAQMNIDSVTAQPVVLEGWNGTQMAQMNIDSATAQPVVLQGWNGTQMAQIGQIDGSSWAIAHRNL
jgi:hypothetical protein